MLSDIQTSMIKLLEIMELSEDQIMAVMLCLQDDEQLIALAAWIDENPLTDSGDVVRKAVEMSEEDN